MLTDTLDELLDLCESRPAHGVVAVAVRMERLEIARNLARRGWTRTGIDTFARGRSTLLVAILSGHPPVLLGRRVDAAYLPESTPPALRREVLARLLVTAQAAGHP